MTHARRQRSGAVVDAALFVVAATTYTVLGRTVAHGPPAGIDRAARAIAGEAPGVAWIFTESCLWPVLLTFGVAGCIVAVRVRTWRARIVFAIATTIVAWQTSNVLKDLFARPRPVYWIVHRETTFAYSSGHAMFAVIVYWLWAYHVARSTAPPAVRTVIATILAVWGAGVIWSRLALGAHYPTDLIGGVLLAFAMLALAAAVARSVAPSARVL